MASEATNVSPDAPRATGLAQRYARALLDFAGDEQSVDAVAADLGRLAELWRDDQAFRAFVADPRIAAADQQRGAFALLERAEIGGAVRSLVGVLVNNRRLNVLPAVLTAFDLLLAEQRGQQTAEVTTAHTLSATQRNALVARLTEAGYSNVRLVEHLDPSVLGGLIVRIGSRLYDTSIKSRLQRLGYAMKGAA